MLSYAPATLQKALSFTWWTAPATENRSPSNTDASAEAQRAH